MDRHVNLMFKFLYGKGMDRMSAACQILRALSGANLRDCLDAMKKAAASGRITF